MRRVGWTWLGAVCLWGSVGCTPQFEVSNLALERVAWDSLTVQVDFAARGASVAPETTFVYLFDANYDTLYTGTAYRIPIPDQQLGDRERVLVEVCGTWQQQTVCEQEGFTASPKRFLLTPEVTYPEDDVFEKGRYAFDLQIERQQYGAETWAPIPRPSAFEQHLVAYVTAQSGEQVKVPLSRSRGRFNLAQYDNFRDFKFYLQSTLFDDQEVTVMFEVIGTLRNQRFTLAQIEKVIRRKTDDERLAEVGHFVEQAAEQLQRKLGYPLVRHRDVYVFLNTWRFQPIPKQYEITFELHRQGHFFRSDWAEWTGQVVVNEDGSEPSYRLIRANPFGQRQWAGRVQARELALSAFSLPPAPEVASDTTTVSGIRNPTRPRSAWRP